MSKFVIIRKILISTETGFAFWKFEMVISRRRSDSSQIKKGMRVLGNYFLYCGPRRDEDEGAGVTLWLTEIEELDEDVAFVRDAVLGRGFRGGPHHNFN